MYVYDDISVCRRRCVVCDDISVSRRMSVYVCD